MGEKISYLDDDWNALHKTNSPIDDLTYTLPPGGWIYVLETSSDYNRFKLGKTNGHPQGPFRRFSNLHTGDPYMMIKGAFFIPARLGSAKSVEAMLHEGISDRRIIDYYGERTEWFRGTPNWAIEHIRWELAYFAKQDDVRYRSDLPPDLNYVVLLFESELRHFFGKSESV